MRRAVKTEATIVVIQDVMHGTVMTNLLKMRVMQNYQSKKVMRLIAMTVLVIQKMKNNESLKWRM